MAKSCRHKRLRDRGEAPPRACWSARKSATNRERTGPVSWSRSCRWKLGWRPAAPFHGEERRRRCARHARGNGAAGRLLPGGCLASPAANAPYSSLAPRVVQVGQSEWLVAGAFFDFGHVGRQPRLRLPKSRKENDVLGESPQIIDQTDAQHDGHGPQLTDRQGRDGFKSLDEAGDIRLIQVAIGVSDQLQGKCIDARKPARGPSVNLGSQR